MGKLINMDVSSWNTGAQEHNLLYSGWTSSTGDYLSLKAAGNSTSGHGNLIIGDTGLWYGTMDTENVAQATDSATNPNGGSNRFRVDSSGNGTFAGNVSIPVNKSLYFGGGSHTYIREDIDDRLRFFTGGAEFMRFSLGNNKVDFYKNVEFAGSGTFADTVTAPNFVLTGSDGFNLPSNGMVDWGNGDARIREGLVNNYSLSFQTYNGSAVTTALRLDGDNTASFEGDVNIDSSSASGSTVLDVQGSEGQLFSVTNSLSGDLFSVSDVSGIPILNVNSSGQVDIDGNLETGGIVDPTIKIKSLAGGDPTLIFDAQAANRSARIKFYDNGSNVGGFIDYLHNGDKMNFGSGSSTGVTMTVGDGAVGIGVQTPLDYYANDLVVLGGDEKGITIANSSTTGKSYLCFADGTTGAAQYTGYVAYDHNDNSLSFATNGGNNRLTINNTGLSTFYGSGTQAKFQSTSSYSDIIFTNSSGTGGFINFGGTTSFNVYVGGGSGGNLEMSLSNSGTLTVSGDVVAFGSPSDIRLKENIKPIESALEKVMKLKGVTFDWKDKEDALDREGNPVKLKKWKNDIGFIAQEVKEVVPELVKENKEGMLSVRHQGVTPILLEAIKELKAEIEELKKHKCNCK
jgi:hypothetical protein